MWPQLTVCVCLCAVQMALAQSAAMGYGPMQTAYYYPNMHPHHYAQQHPHHSMSYLQHPHRQFYQQQPNHQNVYPAQLYTYAQQMGSGPNSNILYQYTTPSVHQGMMMTSASSPEVSATVVQPDKPQSIMGQSKDKKNVHSPDGIVFGRPLAGYDGNFYVPVFYPISWVLSSSSQQSSYASPPTTPVGYGIQAAYLSPAAQQSQYSPMAYYGNPMQYRVESMRMPYNNNNGKRDEHLTFTPEEMMPSDVTPDLNGNFKRANQAKQYGDTVHSYLDSHTGYAYPSMDNSVDASTYSYAHDNSNSGTYDTPVLKFRDPKDEYNLAIETNKQQIEAQKRFEKEVLMTDYRADSNSVDNQPRLESNGTDIDEYNANIRKNYIIESRIDSSQQRTGKSAKTGESPIMTSIEIYDLPGANKYLGLAPTTSNNQSTDHSQPTKYSQLLPQLTNHPA